MSLKNIILFFIFILCSFFATAQEKPMIHMTEEDGLTSNSVRCMLKDKDGLMWFGTDNGLSKFDGTSFKNFNTKDDLPGNKIWALASDNSGRLYVGCYLNGLAIIKNDKVIKTYYLDSAYFRNSIRKLYYSEHYQTLIIGTDYGAHLLKDSTIIYLNYPVDLSQKVNILSIIEHNGIIYLTSHLGTNSIYKLEINKDNPYKSKVSAYNESVSGYKFTSHIIKNEFYSNVYGHIIKSPIDNLSSQKVLASSETTFMGWCSCILDDNKILYGGLNEGIFTGGLKIYDVVENEIFDFQQELNGISIYDLFFDKDSKVIWICTYDGIYALPDSPFEISYLNRKEKLIDAEFFDNSFYVLFDDGVYTYTENNYKLIKTYAEINHKINTSLNFEYADFNAVPKGLTIRDNSLFIVTNAGNIELENSNFNRFLPFDNDVYHSDGKGGFYFVPNYEEGRYFPDITKNEYELLRKANISISRIIGIVSMGETYFFASSLNGLYAKNDSNLFQLNDSKSPLNNFLSDIKKAPDGEIWCTSTSGNLYNIGFNKKLHIKKNWNENNSAIAGNNYKWIQFNDSNIFIGTNKCLAILPIHELYNDSLKSIQIYNKFNGYPFTSADKSFVDDDGNIYVLTDNKLVKINGRFTTIDKSQLHLKNIKVNKQSVVPGDFNNKRLSSSTKQISIEWCLMKYPIAKNVIYNYRINNEIWNKGNSIKFESIKPGTYVVNIKAEDMETSNVYSKTLIFEIAKPLIQKTWFILILVILITLILFLFYRTIHNRITWKKIERLNLMQANSELRIKSLQGQMNPHFIFNSLNSIQSFILTERNNEALEYLGIFGKLIRGNLEHLSQEYISLNEEIEFLKNYISIEKLRFKKRLNIKLENHISDLNLLIPPMIIQPVIENAIKHGIQPLKGVGKVTIKLESIDNLIVINIEDNGVGRNQNNSGGNGNNIGMKSIEQRLLLLNKKNISTKNSIQFFDLNEDGKSVGTKVVIIFDSPSIEESA